MMPGHAESKNEQMKFERIYQYSDGTYLPDSSQPNTDEDYKIVSNLYTPHKSTRYINVVIGNNGKAKREKSEENFDYEEKDLPELYEDRKNCCGCTACYAICPANAIQMMPDEEGFLYPIVDAEKCIRCYKCLEVCAFKKAQKEKGYA